MVLIRHVARMGDSRNSFKIVTGKPREKRRYEVYGIDGTESEI